jgi:CspA family cold shock protein
VVGASCNAGLRPFSCEGREEARTHGPRRNGQVVQRGEGLRLHLPDDRDEDIFVHYSDIEGSGFRSLEVGERVTYEVGQRSKGLQAVNVSKAAAETAPTGSVSFRASAPFFVSEHVLRAPVQHL